MSPADYINSNMEKIDENITERLLRRIIILERDNLKSKECNSSQMVDRLIKIIEEELACF